MGNKRGDVVVGLLVDVGVDEDVPGKSFDEFVNERIGLRGGGGRGGGGSLLLSLCRLPGVAEARVAQSRPNERTRRSISIDVHGEVKENVFKECSIM